MSEWTRDIFFGKLVRLLAALGLEMHQNIKGRIYVCPRRRRPHGGGIGPY